MTQLTPTEQKVILSKTSFYKKWVNMKYRCNNKNCSSYRNYGARGIKVCESWTSFRNFERDMYQSYLEHLAIHGNKNTTIDRVNSDGDYCKENCRWETRSNQNRNRRVARFKYMLPRGVQKHGDKFVARISDKYKVTYLGLHSTPEEAGQAYLNALQNIKFKDQSELDQLSAEDSVK